MTTDPAAVLSPGTQVVIRVPVVSAGAAGWPRGAVGVVVKAPEHPEESYVVRFADGGTRRFQRADLAIRKHHQAETAVGEVDPDALRKFVIYRCVVGSRAFGLATAESDSDRRGIYLPPADLYLSLYGVPAQLENDSHDECYWELRKFLVLALKANPNVLECLYTPLVEYASPLAEALLRMRDAFLSKLIYQTYNGYAISQFKKIGQDLRNRGEIRWKHAMHLLRLLMAGTEAMRSGRIMVDVGKHRDSLLAVKEGRLSWDEVDAWRKRLHGEFDDTYKATSLPDQPDYDAANAFLIRARRATL
jgi:predicted nucleotidyltransferase